MTDKDKEVDFTLRAVFDYVNVVFVEAFLALDRKGVVPMAEIGTALLQHADNCSRDGEDAAKIAALRGLGGALVSVARPSKP